MRKKTKFLDIYPCATDVFSDWADQGRDEGMERGHAASVDFMFDKMADKFERPFKAIDCGCGNGWVVRKFSKTKKCISVLGIDGAKNMIKKAQAIDDNNQYICTDILRWEPSCLVDIIFSMEVLYYLEKPQKFIKQVYDKWLNQTGSFIFGIDHYEENYSSLNWSKECGVNMNTQSIDFWLDVMEQTGFSKIDWWQTGAKSNWAGTLIIRGDK